MKWDLGGLLESQQELLRERRITATAGSPGDGDVGEALTVEGLVVAVVRERRVARVLLRVPQSLEERRAPQALAARLWRAPYKRGEGASSFSSNFVPQQKKNSSFARVLRRRKPSRLMMVCARFASSTARSRSVLRQKSCRFFSPFAGARARV